MAATGNREGYLKLIESQPSIAGRFSDIRRVGVDGGNGFFSWIFSAEDAQTGRTVALKVFARDVASDPYRFQCFCREALLLERLAGSPNVLSFVAPRADFTVNVSGPGGIPLGLSFPYFAVELASTDFASIIRTGAWTAEQRLLGFREMCKAVQRVHHLSIVHRDIKPSNFLVMGDGAVKLSDFGTARLLDGSTPALLGAYSAPPGDWRYASPEMLALLHDDDPTVAHWADIFALGATLFELFSGVILGVQIFDASFATDLARAMNAVTRNDRKRVYMQFVQSLDAGHPLPSISAYRGAPPCIVGQFDGLYRSMAALDYRRRLCDFATIFLKIDQMLLVLRNEEKVRRWRQTRDVYRRNRGAKPAPGKFAGPPQRFGERQC